MGVGVSRTEFGASSGDSIERLVPGFPHLLGDSDDFRGDPSGLRTFLPGSSAALFPSERGESESPLWQIKGRRKVLDTLLTENGAYFPSP